MPRLICSILVLFGAGGLWFAISLFAADQHYRNAISRVKSLSHADGPQAHATWNLAKEYLDAALSRQNPLYTYQLGRLYEFRAADPFARDSQKIFDRDKALEYYESAVRQRPTWSIGWASLAHLRALSTPASRLAETDYQTALKVAGHEREAIRRNVITGMVRWDYLDSKTRANLADSTRDFLQDRREVNGLITKAVKMGWVERLRPIAQDVLGVENFNRRLSRINKN